MSKNFDGVDCFFINQEILINEQERFVPTTGHGAIAIGRSSAPPLSTSLPKYCSHHRKQIEENNLVTRDELIQKKEKIYEKVSYINKKENKKSNNIKYKNIKNCRSNYSRRKC